MLQQREPLSSRPVSAGAGTAPTSARDLLPRLAAPRSEAGDECRGDAAAPAPAGRRSGKQPTGQGAAVKKTATGCPAAPPPSNRTLRFPPPMRTLENNARLDPPSAAGSVAGRVVPAEQPRPAPQPAGTPAPPAPPAREIYAAPAPAPAISLPRLPTLSGTWIAFLLLVALPLLGSAWYLYARAADQYASYLGFAVHSTEEGAASGLLQGLPGLSALTGNSSSDTEILDAFLRSQALVSAVQDRVDLAALWAKPAGDPLFAYDPAGTIEDLMLIWPRMVRSRRDRANGLISLEVRAFTPEDARAIARAIQDESTALMNRISAAARRDATAYAGRELNEARVRLAEARVALAEFRNRSQMADPRADLQADMNVLARLEQELAAALVDYDLLGARSEGNSARGNAVVAARQEESARRAEALRQQIAQQRQKFGEDGEKDYSNLLSEFEKLSVDLEFAQQSYVTALAARQGALANAQRQSRYLAIYEPPALAQRPIYPRRGRILAVAAVFLLLGWAVAVLGVQALRDRI